MRSVARFVLCSSAVVAAIAGSLPTASHASPISIVGGFSTFFGPVASATGEYAEYVKTQVNGTTMFADEPLPGGQFGFDNYGIGLKHKACLQDDDSNAICDALFAEVEFKRNFFGTAGPNRISFTPATGIDVQPHVEFKLGTFYVENGSWFGNSPGSSLYPDTYFDFELRTVSDDPALDGHVFKDTIRFIVTSPVDPALPPEFDADRFEFVQRSDLGSLNVYEKRDLNGNLTPFGNLGQIDLYGYVGSLIPTSFANASGGAFVVGSPAAVPAPSTLMLLLGGIIGLGALRLKLS